jgi:hypothetical protein
MMKSNLYTMAFLLALLISACQNKKETGEHQHEGTSLTPAVQADTVRKSIPKEEHAQIGKAHLTIRYHAPAVRGRTIWNGLVPYGEVWVTGAHSATSFEVDQPVIVAEKEIPPGKYALFTIPGPEKWTIIVNSNWDQHLADEYDEKDDVIRLTVTPEQNENVQERLKYSIVADGETRGTVLISWEKIKVTMPFQVK